MPSRDKRNTGKGSPIPKVFKQQIVNTIKKNVRKKAEGSKPTPIERSDIKEAVQIVQEEVRHRNQKVEKVKDYPKQDVEFLFISPDTLVEKIASAFLKGKKQDFAGIPAPSRAQLAPVASMSRR
eukprot:CAMPEP_0113881992 /NCGR_PEP_ID=MMETSP0780_2-20120614/8692_1 /TAXON_ID=652834 /ORGANISM="Palpitomonas bilix" /LENGTH=123 /DNA_ID=CAMNT_0000868927 /DNA_START=99 /DNA_END=470 /DNA_ORIENTATION=+ /assembly_acc=CAM_ASM_000599